MLKIAICTPHYGNVTPEYAACVTPVAVSTA
jgi:hypothetical protein